MRVLVLIWTMLVILTTCKSEKHSALSNTENNENKQQESSQQESSQQERKQQDHCPHSDKSSINKKIDVHYINLDRSVDRRKYMENQLNFYGLNHKNRVRAVTIKDIVIPHEIAAQKECRTASNLTISYVTSSKHFNYENSDSRNSLGTLGSLGSLGSLGTSHENVPGNVPQGDSKGLLSSLLSLSSVPGSTSSSYSSYSSVVPVTPTTLALATTSPAIPTISTIPTPYIPPYKIIITELCGRPKNTRKELAVTISHLLAIRAGIMEVSDCPYLLILEDDSQIAFEIDFIALVNSAPKDFGMLQLVTSNDYDVKSLLKDYTKDNSHIWQLRVDQDFWCAGAYIVNKAAIKPYLERIIVDLQNGWIGAAVTAGYDKPCFPTKCCAKNKGHYVTNSLIFSPPCVNAPRGYHSDHFLFRLALGRTYMITVPIVTSAAVGNQSTLHQEHVALHNGAFARINRCLADLKSGVLPAPSFLNTGCSYEKSARTKR